MIDISRQLLNISGMGVTKLVLKKLGLVEKLHFDEGHCHYGVKPSIEHHHLICLSSGKVVEFEQPLFRYLKRNGPDGQGV